MLKSISSFFKNQFFLVIFAGDKFRIKSTIILGMLSTSIITFLLHEQIQRVSSRPGIDENWMLRNYFTNQLNLFMHQLFHLLQEISTRIRRMGLEDFQVIW